VLGRKRHVLTDTLGLLLAVVVRPANVQDRDGAEAVLREARRLFPFLERIVGDAGYQGPKMAAAVARTGTWTLEIVRRCDRHRFVALPKRWIVERTLAWISRNRRLARDYERHARKADRLWSRRPGSARNTANPARICSRRWCAPGQGSAAGVRKLPAVLQEI
jgi:transposase